MTITNCQPSQAHFATDEIDEADCATRRLAKYLVGATRDVAFKTVCVGAVLAQKASGIRTCFKTPLGNGFSNIALTTMPFKFLGRLNVAIGGSLKRSAIHSLV